MNWFIASILAFALIGCSSAPAADSEQARTRARQAYDQLSDPSDAEYMEKKASPQETSTQESLRGNKGETSMDAPSQGGEWKDGPAPSVLVMPSAPLEANQLEIISKNPLAKAAQESINEYLTARQYEVFSLEGQQQVEDLLRFQRDFRGLGDDPAILAGVALGADIFIKYSGSVQTNGANVELYAYETSTARLLGSQTAQIEGTVRAADTRNKVYAAVQKALPGLEKKILDYLQRDRRNGVPYRLQVNFSETIEEETRQQVQDSLVSILDSHYKSYKINTLSATSLDAQVYADPGKVRDSHALYRDLAKSLNGLSKVKLAQITKKLILLDAE